VKKIYSNKDLLSDCVELLEAYQEGSIDPDSLDKNTQDLLSDIKFKYPKIAWYNRMTKKEYGKRLFYGV
tara:strand:+ start:118 stop:324 length:207 start_codon:yes stop_codon:yes gene_type:complete